MKEFMVKLFNEFNMNIFQSYECDGYDVVYAKDEVEEAYYLNVFINTNEEMARLKGEYEKLYEGIKNINYDEYKPAMDKNTCCIVYYCISNDEYKKFRLEDEMNELEKNVCDIEEDLYYFKKNVLVYSEKQLNYVKTIENFDELCNEFISDKNNFDKFKAENIEFFEYDLIMNMFTKFPFLNYTRYFKSNGNQLKSLDEYIKIELNNNNFSDEKQLQCENIYKELSELEDDKLEKWLDDFGGVIR
ncbi:hypothetical protein J2Z53_001702 [Clostridium moniliforme]|uniref:Uncharacterized protein n=1 Tax=Clostridium moniliforme TaxID=39489 RepID=A0ABS4F1J7_9CLOT|nr:ABC-three component system middle component 1 [Clostridium moniliforme]MBP1890118.1 hypothetical protein [Clostridium moniliforme]